MKIQTENFELISDENCIQLNRRMMGQKGKIKGKEYTKPVGYYPDFGVALDQLLSRGMMASEAQTFEEMRTDFNNLRDEVKEIMVQYKTEAAINADTIS
jgi:hypothetical protein